MQLVVGTCWAIEPDLLESSFLRICGSLTDGGEILRRMGLNAG